VPELPEVETTRRGLEKHLIGHTIKKVIIRNGNLRWPIPKNLPRMLQGCTIHSLKRRAKYLLMDCGKGTLILHLGMSGSLRILSDATPAGKHDHFDLILDNGTLMRLRDPRRFGAVLWQTGDIQKHLLLAKLGPEPLEESFNAHYLHQATRCRTASIKQCLMDNHIVVGVGNIYANEALFRAGIQPAALRKTGRRDTCNAERSDQARRQHAARFCQRFRRGRLFSADLLGLRESR